MKLSTILLIILAVIIIFSILGFILSLVGAIIAGFLRFIFGPLGVIALIILVIYLLKRK